MTDGDKALAEKLRDELLDRAWGDREAFVYKLEALDDSLARAKSIEPPKPGEGPIVLLDHYDNCASGGTMDTTAVLAAILREGLDNVAAFAIFDPEAVQQAIAAGIGAEVTMSIGGKMAMPQIPGESRPLTITGTVKTISSGRFRNKGPSSRGVQMDMGPSVVIDTGKVEIAVISRHVEPNDLNCFYTLGIDPMQKRYLMLKSRIHWRAGLGSLAKAVVECAGHGVCTSDYSQLTFNNVRRPIYPLDLPKYLESDRHRYCGAIPASLAVLIHFAVSARKNAVNSAEFCGSTSTPRSVRRCLDSGIASTFSVSASILFWIALSTPMGAHIPYQDETS